MPYALRKKPNENLYWVINKETGRKLSTEALPLKRAQNQMKAVYASESDYSTKNKK